MIAQHLKLLFRKLSRQKLHYLITISGIIIGLTAIWLSAAVITDELAYDRFHQKADRIFRVNKHYFDPSGERSKNAETPGLLAPTLQKDYPEVEVAAHVAPWFEKVLITHDNQNLEVQKWVFADSNFFRIFDFQLLKGGQAAEALSKPGQALLTPRLVNVLFGNQNPIGKTFVGLSNQLYTVSGIIEPAPRQSHLQYDLIASWASTEGNSGVHNFSFLNNWLGQTVYTYVQLNQVEQHAAVNKKLKKITAQYMPNRVDRYEFYLQPLLDIYLHSDDIRYLRGGKYGSATFLRTFSLIALLILLIAGFNYINITTVQSLQRAKEVGVRKVLGAKRGQIVRQFLIETIGISVISAFIALVLASLLLPQFNQWFDKNIPLNTLLHPWTLTFMILVVGITALLSGVFPGKLLAAFRPVSMLRDDSQVSPGGHLPRQLLTTLQLAVSMALIVATLIIHQQFQFLLGHDLGFDKDQVLVMRTPAGIDSSAVVFQQELGKMAGVKSVSICQAAMGDGTFGSTVIPEGNNGEELPVQIFRVDSNYLNTYGLDLAAGRFLDRSSDQSSGAVVANQAFIRQMGWTSGVGKTIQFPGNPSRNSIVGVVKDFNYAALHQAVAPALLYLDSRRSHVSVRFDPSKVNTLLPNLQALWKRFESRYPFDYYFLDDYFAKSYQAEQRMVRIITLFAGLAVFIACLGLYGLAAFAIARRRKEIGIRKILGASFTNILVLLNRNFLVLGLIAMLIATPVVWYFLQTWLQNFNYHITINPWFFFISGGILLAIVLLTVNIQSLRAALKNPVDSLKNE